MKQIELSHGSGGKASQNLLDSLIVPLLSNPELNRLEDCALLGAEGCRLAFTTDSYVVDPIFFPGGDIGSLAVHGTLNDLATSGAEPLGLALAAILEEGFALEDLRRVLESAARACQAAGVSIVTGDTKVVPRGKGDRIYLTTTGVGLIRHPHQLGSRFIRPGDQLLLSGPLGDHGIAILGARGDLGLELEVVSDSAPLHGLVADLLAQTTQVRCLKDPTRGGLASTLNELAVQSGTGMQIQEQKIPVRPEVKGACELLGLDPLYVANEGRMLVVVGPDEVDLALECLRRHPLGTESVHLGEVRAEPQGLVFVRTAMGGARVLDRLTGALLPRIC